MRGALIAALGLMAAPTALAAQADDVEATSLLGKPLRRPAMSAAARSQAESNLAGAQAALRRTPSNLDSMIWVGRRLGYLGRFKEAIAQYTAAIAVDPSDARLYRHRGHRYLSVRRLDDAIADLERADQLTRNRPDAVEPDGQPNARGIPTSTLHSNIRYHLGLGYYLKGAFEKALPFYRRDVDAAVNPDMVVASSHWLYMTLRRLGRDREAAAVLAPINREWTSSRTAATTGFS